MLYTPVMTARAVGYNSFMPSYPHIEQYRTKLQELIEFGGSDNEENIRPAFQNCLDAYCHDHRERLVLIPELKNSPSNKPDGTVKDSLRMARGYWEAKDSHDDLDAEIKVKFNRGYPRDNIIFEDSQTAVLVQNGNEAMRVDMSRDGELHRLIRIFLDYELPEIQEFRHAQGQFKTDLPTVLENLRATVTEAEADNPEYQEAASSFLDLCRRTIGPAVSPADVREMLLQHILTKDIFLSIFREDQFHRENNVARQLDSLEGTFFTGDVRRQAIDRLRAYYGVIGRAADEIADYAEKQQFLKAIYEDFYTAYNPAAADRLGVVYTPNEVVDFIIRGADHLLQKHFGKTLADDNVQILDPATGTGTFITNLINHLPADRLEHKYRHEIHANEVAILPYYIANLNIEYTYQQRTGRYQWLSSRDTEIQGETGSTYTLVGADEGKTIKVRVSFTDDVGNQETLTSAATAAVAEAEPMETLPAPTNLTAAVSEDGSVTLSWEATDDDSVHRLPDPAPAPLRGGEDAAGVRGEHGQHGDHLHRHRRDGGNAARVPGEGHQRGWSGRAVQLRQRGPVDRVVGVGSAHAARPGHANRRRRPGRCPGVTRP